MMELKKLKSCYPLFTNGIFSLIRFYSSQEQSLFSTWLTNDKAQDLDVQIIAEYGDKPIAPLIYNLLENGTLSDTNKLNISRYIYNKFKTNWEHYLKIDLAEYDILKPYNITEVYDEDSNINTTKTGTVSNQATNTNTGTDNLSKTINQTDRFSGADTMAKTGTETDVLDRTNDNTTTTDRSETGTSDSTDNAFTFGFNTGNDPVGTNRNVNDTDTTASIDETITNNTDEDSTNTTTYNTTDTTTYGKVNTQTGTNSDNRTLNLQETRNNTETNNLENNEDITKDSTTTRTGNIGNHSFTELLAKELEFWNDFNVQNKIFRDVISVLVLPIYQIDI